MPAAPAKASAIAMAAPESSVTTGEISLAFRSAIVTADASELATRQRGGLTKALVKGPVGPVQPSVSRAPRGGARVVAP